MFDKLEAWERFGEKHGRSLLDVAIAGLAAMPAVASVIAHGRFKIACGARYGRLYPPVPCSWTPELNSSAVRQVLDSTAVEFGNPGAAVVAAGTTAARGS